MKRLGEAANDAERAAEAALLAIGIGAGDALGYEPACAAVMSPVHRGVDAASWRVTVDGASQGYFLKVYADDLVVPIDPDQVFRASAAAAKAGVAPEPLGCTKVPAAVIGVDLGPEWRTAHVDDLRDPDIRARIVAAKTEIHALPPFGRVRDVFADVAELAGTAHRHGVALPEDAEALIAAAREAGQAIAAAGIDRRPCHGDGVSSNVMIGPGNAVRLVDFDEAGDADPLFDIAIAANEGVALPEEFALWLEVAEGHVRDDHLARCLIYAFADDLRWSLWGRIMDMTSPRGGVEFLKYAQWRWLRCRMTARMPAFAGLAGRV